MLMCVCKCNQRGISHKISLFQIQQTQTVLKEITMINNLSFIKLTETTIFFTHFKS